MAENKKSFIAYTDWKETFDTLPDEKAGQLIKHIFAYVSDENPETDDLLINAVFVGIKKTLKRDLVKYEQYVEKQKLNGSKGGRPKTQIEPKEPKPLLKNPSEPKKADSVSVSVSVSESKKIKKKEFIPPTLDEVKMYFKENGYQEQIAIKMFESYSVADWVDSKGNKILNWKQKSIQVWFDDKNKIPSQTKKMVY